MRVTVTDIYRYPVKSMAGDRLESVDLTANGIPGDRCWTLKDEQRGGIKGGTAYGATDELGYHVVDNKATIFDLWATVLHQLGIDHEDFTYRYAGRDVRLTDVHGNVLRDILA